jgi:hypothetical protein
MRTDPPALRWGRRHGDILVAWEPANRELLPRLAQARVVRTPTFAVLRGRSSTLIVHRLDGDAVDNDIGQLVADELVRPRLVVGSGAFERCFAGLVESTARSPRAAWRRFYLNTLRGLRGARGAGAGHATEAPIEGRPAEGPIGTFARIYRHAEWLTRGASVLDVGSCFAFFPMLLAAGSAVRVTATDANSSTVALGQRMAAELKLPLAFATCDVTRRLPFPAASFDTVTALHVLEHLAAEETVSALERLCLVARRRVIVAVPLERLPDAVYGHEQSFDMGRLSVLADRVPGWQGQAHEHLGGWLVLQPREPCRRGVGG